MKQKQLEILLVAGLLVICLILGLWLYLPKSGDTVAIITVDGTEYARIPLKDAEDQIFSVEATENTPAKPVSFEIKDHKIRFIQVTCPDHLCEQTGWCSKPGERAVCMPNRTAVVCYAENEL